MSHSKKIPDAGAVGAATTRHTKELVILTSLFFIWGFLTCLNDILIPHLKAVFALSYAQSMLIQFSFFGAYFIVSAPSGALVQKVGYKTGIIIGLVIAGTGCLLFYPSAGLRSYALFLAALFILASGITLLQVSANPYVTVLGSQETSSSRLTLTQAFNSLGTTVAPFFGSLIILSVVLLGPEETVKLSAAELEAYRIAESSVVQMPYLGLAITLFIIAVMFYFFKLPSISEINVGECAVTERQVSKKSVWEYRHLVLGALAIFVYVGAEVAIGSFMVNFISDGSIGGLSKMKAGTFVAYYWGGAMIGRFVGSAVMQKINPDRVLGFNAAGAALLVLVTIVTSGKIAMWSILLVGVFNSIMFPSIFSLSVRGLGEHTCQGSGILCMAIVGGAILPILQGVLADHIGIHYSFALPLLCYIYILIYALKGSAVRELSTEGAGI